MTIRYLTTRGDLLAANFRSLVHNRFLWAFWTLAIIWLCYGALRAPEVAARGLGYKIGLSLFTAAFHFAMLFSLTFVLVSLMVLLRKNRGVLGEHRLTISPEGLVEATAYNESLNRWSAYHRTVSTKRYLMLYVTEGQFHIVPKRRPLLEGDLAAFEAALAEKTETRGSATV